MASGFIHENVSGFNPISEQKLNAICNSLYEVTAAANGQGRNDIGRFIRVVCKKYGLQIPSSFKCGEYVINEDSEWRDMCAVANQSVHSNQVLQYPKRNDLFIVCVERTSCLVQQKSASVFSCECVQYSTWLCVCAHTLAVAQHLQVLQPFKLYVHKHSKPYDATTAIADTGTTTQPIQTQPTTAHGESGSADLSEFVIDSDPPRSIPDDLWTALQTEAAALLQDRVVVTYPGENDIFVLTVQKQAIMVHRHAEHEPSLTCNCPLFVEGAAACAHTLCVAQWLGVLTQYKHELRDAHEGSPLL